ncbi:MAG: hypothetical protein R2813_11930 [Flavobacteriales bacterium]
MSKYLLSVIAVITLFMAGCDQCKEITCINGSSCEKGECQCIDGYSGDRCEIEDRCITRDIACQNGGTCSSGECNCPEGFSGANCQIEDLCITENPNCRNGGECEDGKCNCPSGFTGDRCEIPVVQQDPCDTVTCQNGQPCESGTCNCNMWTNGTYCENKVIEKYIDDGDIEGYWYYKSDGSYAAYALISFSKNNDGLNMLDFDFEFGSNTFTNVYLEFSDTENFDIPSQQTGSVTIEGYGYYDGFYWYIEIDDGSEIYYFDVF